MNCYKVSIDKVADTMFKKCLKYNDLIEWFGYYEATHYSDFQDVHSYDRLLNSIGIPCTIVKDNHNMKIVAVRLYGRTVTIPASTGAWCMEEVIEVG